MFAVLAVDQPQKPMLTKMDATANVIIATMIKMADAISMTSLRSSSATEVAAQNHRFWFVVYLGWIVLGAFASAILTGMLWRAGNRQQNAVIAETNERTN